MALGPTGAPTAIVFAQPIVLGPPAIARPVRVPNATFRDVGLFAQDEWDLSSRLKAVAGLRLDSYNVTTSPTPGRSSW